MGELQDVLDLLKAGIALVRNAIMIAPPHPAASVAPAAALQAFALAAWEAADITMAPARPAAVPLPPSGAAGVGSGAVGDEAGAGTAGVAGAGVADQAAARPVAQGVAVAVVAEGAAAAGAAQVRPRPPTMPPPPALLCDSDRLWTIAVRQLERTMVPPWRCADMADRRWARRVEVRLHSLRMEDAAADAAAAAAVAAAGPAGSTVQVDS